MFKGFARLVGAAGVLLTLPTLYAKGKDKPKNTTTYIWGNGFYQARPDAILQFKNLEPKRITTFTGDMSLQKLRFSEHFEAGIDLKGNLHIWPAKRLDSNFS